MSAGVISQAAGEPVEQGVETVAHAAARWGTSPDFIRSKINSGELPAFRASRKVIRVRPADVDALFALMNAATVELRASTGP